MGNPSESENFDPSRHSPLGESGTPQKIPEIRKSQSPDAGTVIEVLDLRGQPDTAVEPQSELPELKEEAEKKEPSASEAMVEALRRFVRQEAAKAGEGSEQPTEFSARQVTVLLLLTADLVLAYMSLPQEVLALPVMKFVSALIPWLLGASAFAYAEKLRGWFLAKCDNTWVGLGSMLAFVLLLPMQLPLFSTQVKLEPMTSLAAENPRHVQVQQLQDGAKLLFSGLNSYTVTVTSQDLKIRNAKDFRVTLGRWQIARTTLAQVPFVGGLFGSKTISLTPLYSFNVISSSGMQNIEVEGSFPPGFVDTLDYWHAKQQAGRTILYPPILFGGTNLLVLPAGTYDFRARQAECLKEQKAWTVQGATGAVPPKIDFDKLDCSHSP